PEDAIADVAQSELAIDTVSIRLQQLLKWYAPLVGDEITGLLEFFEIHPSPFKIKRLSATVQPVLHASIQQSEIIEPTQTAIRDWLEDNHPNRQLLHGLRKGVVFWLRSVRPFGYFHYPNISRSSRVLRDQKTQMSLFPPI